MRRLDLLPEDKAVIIASDGLWDVIGDQDVVTMVDQLIKVCTTQLCATVKMLLATHLLSYLCFFSVTLHLLSRCVKIWVLTLELLLWSCKTICSASLLCALPIQDGQEEQDKTQLAHKAAQKLVQIALQRGTADNVTALVMLPQWSQ